MEYRYDKIRNWSGGSVYETWQRENENDEWKLKPNSEFYKMEGGSWHSKKSYDILKDELGIETTVARANEFEAVHDCNPNVVYYLGVASPPNTGDEALKLIMGPILAELNTRGVHIRNIHTVISAKCLNYFVSAMSAGVFDRLMSKAILAEIMAMKFSPFGDEYKTQLDTLFNDVRFKPADSSEVENIVKQVIADHPTQVQQAKENEKVAQWFIGPVMKATKGKANPQEVIKLIKKYIAQS